MDKIVLGIVVTTFSCKQEAKVMAKKLMASKLAACVQLAEVESFYTYENESHQELEFRLEIKTKYDLYDKVESFILEQHSYETPEIIFIPIEKASPRYTQWVEHAIMGK